MSYRSLGVLVIMLSAVPTLQGMKPLKQKVGIMCRNVSRNYASNASSKKKIVPIAFQENVTALKENDGDKLYAVESLKGGKSIVMTHGYKPSGSFERSAHVAVGNLSDGNSNCFTFHKRTDYYQEHLYIVIPGVYKQCGAHYRLVPEPESIKNCYTRLFNLPDQSARNKDIIPSLGFCCKYDIVSDWKYSIMVYDPTTIVRNNKGLEFDWGMYFPKKGGVCLRYSTALEEYPSGLLLWDYLRWFCQAKREEQETKAIKENIKGYSSFMEKRKEVNRAQASLLMKKLN